jgi:Na+/melibiose symporter-like transporter
MATRFEYEEGGLIPAVEAVPLHADRPGSTQAPAASALGKLSRHDVIAYGLAAFGPGLLATPMTSYVPQLYAKNFGISLAALGAALTGLRILNAVTDQVVGQVSDMTRTRWGARKPWLVAGAGLMLISAFFLLRPGPMASLGYLVAWKALYDFAYTLTDINYTAWGAELSSNYDTRTKITGMRAQFYMLGNMGNDVLPIVVFWIGLAASSAYSIDMLRFFFVVAVITLPLTTGYALYRAPRGQPLPKERPDILGFIRSVKGNKPLWLYVISFMLAGIGLGVLQIIFTFYDGYLHLGQWYPYLMTVFAITMTLCVPLWTAICHKIGKHKSYFVAMLTSSIAMQGYWFIDPLTMPMSVILSISFVVVVLIGAGASAMIVISPAILGDIADYGRLKTGEQRTGGYYAFYMLTNQVAMAIGAGGSFMMLSAFGYDARAGAVNTGWAAFGMVFTVALLPAIIKVGGASIMLRFPIDKRRHGIIQRRLAQLDARRARDAALASA